MADPVTVYVFGEGVTTFLGLLASMNEAFLLDSEGQVTGFFPLPGEEYQVTIYWDRPYHLYECHGPYLDEDQTCVGVVFVGSKPREEVDLPPDRKLLFVLSNEQMSNEMAPLSDMEVDFRGAVTLNRGLRSIEMVMDAIAELVKNTKKRKRRHRREMRM